MQRAQSLTNFSPIVCLTRDERRDRTNCRPCRSGRAGTTRNWLLVGLILSLALHGRFAFSSIAPVFNQTAPLGLEKPRPPAFKVKSVDLAPKPLDQACGDANAAEAAKPNPDQTDVQLPDDQKSFDKLLQEVHATAAMPDDTRDVLPDKPKVDQTNLNSVINEIERTTAQIRSRKRRMRPANRRRSTTWLTPAGRSRP